MRKEKREREREKGIQSCFIPVGFPQPKKKRNWQTYSWNLHMICPQVKGVGIRGKNKFQELCTQFL